MNTIVSRPLISPLVYDDTTRLLVIVSMGVLCLLTLYKILKYYGQ
jgi:hypothetical protein